MHRMVWTCVTPLKIPYVILNNYFCTVFYFFGLFLCFASIIVLTSSDILGLVSSDGFRCSCRDSFRAFTCMGLNVSVGTSLCDILEETTLLVDD